MRKYLAAAALLCTAASMASAAVVYEPFDYPAGTAIGGQSPDGTHTWAVTGPGTDEPTVVDPAASLAVPSPLSAGVGGSVAFGNKGHTDRIDIGDQSAGVLYYSMALKISDLGTLPTISASNQIVAGFNNSVGAQGTNPTAIGAALWAHPENGTSTTTYNLGITTTSATTGRAYSTAAYNVGDTVFVIGAYDFTASQASLWVFNSTDTLPDTAPSTPTAQASAVVNANYATLRSFLLYQQGNGVTNMLGEGGITLDELRIGTSWADVTSVPEPATLSLAGLGAIGLLGGRRRRSRRA